MSTKVQVHEGEGPVVLGIPHTGTHVPEPIWERLNEVGRRKADTDWHVERLYDGLLEGVSTVRTTLHRYVVDANRDPSGLSLYPGQNTTGLCPVTDFDGRPIYAGSDPGPDEVAERVAEYHDPYHAALSAQVERVRARHGVAILYDCHSIRSRIPYLFDGVLPDLNVGDDDGRTCAPEVHDVVVALCREAEGFGHAVNGRFRGGWTTRAYGKPREGVHAVQMELAQSTYLSEEAPPWSYDAAKAERLRPHLARILTALAELAPSLGRTS